MLCGEVSGEVGERDYRSPLLAIIFCWENSNSRIKEASSSACYLLILTSAAPFHYILVHVILSISRQPPLTLLSKALQSSQVLPPGLTH